MKTTKQDAIKPECVWTAKIDGIKRAFKTKELAEFRLAMDDLHVAVCDVYEDLECGSPLSEDDLIELHRLLTTLLKGTRDGLSNDRGSLAGIIWD